MLESFISFIEANLFNLQLQVPISSKKLDVCTKLKINRHTRRSTHKLAYIK